MEKDLQNEIRLNLSGKGIITFRNNVGMLEDKNGRPVRYGLCVGSSDIIAIKPVVVTKEMVGQTIGQFCAIEVKMKGKKPTEAQINFIEAIKASGGLAGVAYSIEEAEDIIS